MDDAGATVRETEHRKLLALFARTLRNREHQRLLTAIGQALGMPGPFQEWSHRWWLCPLALPPGPGSVEIEVLAGAVDPHLDRVAWVERRVYGNGGWVFVSLNLAGHGTLELPRIREGTPTTSDWSPRISIPLDDDRADRVTGIHHLELRDHELVVVYGMGGQRRIACRLTLSAPGLDGVLVHRVKLRGLLAPVERVAWEGPGQLHHPYDRS